MIAKNMEGKNVIIKLHQKLRGNEKDIAEINNLWEILKLLDHPNIMGESRIFEDDESGNGIKGNSEDHNGMSFIFTFSSEMPSKHQARKYFYYIKNEVRVYRFELSQVLVPKETIVNYSGGIVHSTLEMLNGGLNAKAADIWQLGTLIYYMIR